MTTLRCPRNAWFAWLFAVLIIASPCFSATLVVAAFNVESPNIPGGDPTDPKVIAQEIRSHPDVHLWSLEEVLNDDWVEQFRRAAAEATGRSFDQVTGTTGSGDRLAVLYDSSVLTRTGNFELIDPIQNACGKKSLGAFRAPLIVQFRVRANGKIFWFGANHLQRGKDKPNPYRTCQADQLRLWAAGANVRKVPVVIAGDFNFDWDVTRGDQGDRDQAYDALTRNNVWRWVRPAVLLKTECSPSFDSVLDFFFVNAAAARFPSRAEILHPEPAYCTRDPKHMSDHRPIRATFTID